MAKSLTKEENILLTLINAFQNDEKEKLNHLGIVTYKHYEIEGYPHDITKIISEEGFGKNDYIKTIRER